MSEEVLTNEELKKELASNSIYYEVAEYNSVLYLNNRFYKRIEHLDNLINLKSLYLNNNHLESISGLEDCVNLVALYLNNNKIKKIDHLSTFTKLKILNLENNQISVIENLDKLTELEELNICNNLLGTEGNANVEALIKNPCLTVLNICNNDIKEDILGVLSQLEKLSILYIMNNPIVYTYGNYRRLFTHHIKCLCYLDSAPVTNDDRRCVEAYYAGGEEKEKEEREKIEQERKIQKEKELKYFKKHFMDF